MVLFGAFCNFLCTKKEKKTVPKWLEWMYFCLCIWKWSDTEVWTGTSSVLEKTGKLVCLVAFCVFFSLVCFFFSFFLLFYWAFYIMIKHFLLTFIWNPLWEKAPVGAMMKQSHSCVQHCFGWQRLLLGQQTWYCFLAPLSLLLSTFWVLIALNVVTLQAKST